MMRVMRKNLKEMGVMRIVKSADRWRRRLQSRIFKTRPSTLVVKSRYGNRPIVGCEVGVFEGRNSLNMLEKLPNLERLYLVDPYEFYDGYDDYLHTSRMKNTPPRWNRLKEAKESSIARLRPYESEVVRIYKKFEACHIPELLDYIYIDGNHSFAAVMHDIIQAEIVVKTGGIISGHDYHPKGHHLDERIGVGRAVRRRYGKRLYHALNDWWVINE